MVNPVDVVGGVVGRVRQEITVARFVGKFAVDGALAKLRAQLDGPSDAPVAASPDVVRDPVPSAATHQAEPVAPDVDELALPDYDLLPAAHVVAALADLEPAERDAIEVYERAGRHRRTILGKLDQLRGGPGG